MIGAIIGDIVGSRFEFNNHRDKNFDLFTSTCRVTDDSIMTFAVAKAIMETEKIVSRNDEKYYSILTKIAIKSMQELGKKHPYAGYGAMFAQWLNCDNPLPYNSYGNGAAMRISPVGFYAVNESELLKLSHSITKVSHNHPEGLKGAEAAALAIYMARHNFTKAQIKTRIEDKYYALNFTLDQIRPTYSFKATCQDTVPQAIVAFLEASSFEDAIRNAISLGGDSDTIAAITSGIAEAYYGVPEVLIKHALTYLDGELLDIYHDWIQLISER